MSLLDCESWVSRSQGNESGSKLPASKIYNNDPLSCRSFGTIHPPLAKNYHLLARFLRRLGLPGVGLDASDAVAFYVFARGCRVVLPAARVSGAINSCCAWLNIESRRVCRHYFPEGNLLKCIAYIHMNVLLKTPSKKRNVLLSLCGRQGSLTVPSSRDFAPAPL